MAKYMLLLGGADLDKRSSNTDLAPQMLEHFLGSLRERGHYIHSHELHEHTGARLTVRGGQVVEGPFMETKEAVGGVFLIEATQLARVESAVQEAGLRVDELRLIFLSPRSRAWSCRSASSTYGTD